MRVKALLTIPLLICALCACDFNVSYEKDFTTGIETMGSGLSCDDVYLSIQDNRVERTSFLYGETFHLNFNNITGFNEIDSKVYPSLEILVTAQNGDTVMYSPDIYNNVEGTDISPLLLNHYLTVANPIHSGKRYNMRSTVRDKRGKGIFTAKLKIDIQADKNIKIESNSISYDEVYLFSKERNSTITDGKIKYNEEVNMMLEGLRGFKEENGKVHIGMSIKAYDTSGNVILNEEDLFSEPVDAESLKSRLMSSVIFYEGSSDQKVTFETKVWDKLDNGKISATTSLEVHQ